MQLVQKCQDEITNYHVRVFGRRLRRYILAHHAIEKAKEAAAGGATLQDDNGDTVSLPCMSCQLVEQLVKKKRSHRNIADSEKRFLNYAFPAMKRFSAEI